MPSQPITLRTLLKSEKSVNESGDHCVTPDSAPEWVSEAKAAELLALSESTLKTMRREGRLIPGDHWVYASGNVRGPVTYCIPAIREMQRRLTVRLVNENAASRKAEAKRRREAIETYDEAALEKVIAEVQS